MAGLSSTKNDDAFINQFVASADVAQLKENVVAVEANYILARMLTNEPLATSLGGLLAVEKNINVELDNWKAKEMTPFFVFDGCPVKGQYEQSVNIGREANNGTNEAWRLYTLGQAMSAVGKFGSYTGAYQLESLYPLFQSILKKRGLHFMVVPFKAVSQIAYFSQNEIMCGAIMGSRELLLYPIKDPLIQEIDWETNKFSAVSRDVLMSQLGVDEPIFVDALLITGSSFLSPFPARAQPSQPANTVRDAVNMLRANGKHVKQLCSSFDDILKGQPDWFDEFCKARMIVKHFVYIAESGAVEVENFDALTGDSHEYLGIRLPEELIGYLQFGLIGPHIPSWIIHSQATVSPTVDGIASPEYKDLVLTRLLPVKELALGLVVPRLNRGLHFKDIEVKAWFPDHQTTTIRNSTFRSANPKVATWDVEEKAVSQQFPSWSSTAASIRDRAGSLAFEILSLQKPGFAKDTISKSGTKVRTDSTHHLISSVIWRFLHLRGYIDDSHELSTWGKALATAVSKLELTVKKNPKVPGLYEALLLAFELIRFDQLNNKPRPDEVADGDVDGPLVLVSRCAVLLKLRHAAIGYTGPLRKDMLAFLSQVSAVRDADRDLVDAIVAHLFLNNKSNRTREPMEFFDIGDALPFVNRNHNAAMGVAIRTYLEQKVNKENEVDIQAFASAYFPNTTNLKEDIEIFHDFFDALVAGIRTLDEKEMGHRAAWIEASDYLKDLA